MNGTYEDFEWFALDSVGQIALFTTGNSPFIPGCLSTDDYTLRQVADMVMNMKPNNWHRIIGGGLDTWRTACWTEASDRGLFAYDYNDDDSTYRLFSIPGIPCQFDVKGAEWVKFLPRYGGFFSEHTPSIPAQSVFDWEATIEI